MNYDLAAEAAVLGAMLLAPRVLPDLLAQLSSDDFYSTNHAHVYTAINIIDARGDKPDAIIVCDTLQAANRLEAVGGRAFVHALVSAVPSVAQAEHYATIVRDHALRRRLGDLAAAIERMRSEHGDPTAIANFAAEQLDNLEGRVAGDTLRPIRDSLAEHWEHLELLAAGERRTVGHSCGHPGIDDLLGGLRRGSLLIVAGRPGMGKTALALDIMRRSAEVPDKVGNGIILFSLEQPVQELNARLLSSVTKISSTKLQTADLSEQDWAELSRAQNYLGNLPLYVDDAADITMPEIRARARRLHRKLGGLDLIIVDYLQLIAPTKGYDTREREIAEVSRRLKLLAKELNTPVAALSQLNRSVESRQDKRPDLADLRESGAIEQDADAVLFVYRDEYYHPETTTDQGIAEVIIRKNRHGPTGTVKLSFRPDCGLFRTMPKTAAMRAA